MKRRKLLIVLLSLAVFFVLFVGGSVLLLHSPSFINKIAALLEGPTGYRVRIQSVSLSRGLQGEVRGLEIEDMRGGNFSLFTPQLVVNGKITDTLRGEVESIRLTEPRFYFRLRGEKKESDFSALEKLPPVRSLTIKDGQFSFSSDAFEAEITSLNVDVKDFSPRSGGVMKFHGEMQVSSQKSEGAVGRGICTGTAQLTALFPRPVGSGSVELKFHEASAGKASLKEAVLNLTLSLEKEKILISESRISVASFSYGSKGSDFSIRSARLQAQGMYDTQSAAVTLDSLKGEIPGVGALQGSFHAVFGKDLPWKAAITASSLDFRGLFTLMRPFLSEEYRKWEIEGNGNMEAQLQGHLGEAIGLDGTCVLHFTHGGFMSADKSKAAQKLDGSVVLKLQSGDGKSKGRFDVTARTGDGEFLWGKYYRDFKGQTFALSSQGTYSLDPPLAFECSGQLDLPGIAPLVFSTSREGKDYTASLSGPNISHPRLLALLAADYLNEENKIFSSARLEGESSFTATVRWTEGRTRIEGRLETKDTSLAVPSLDLSVQGINVDLPFNFALPPPIGLPAIPPPAGSVGVDRLERGELRLEKVMIPVRLSGNRLDLLEEIVLPLFGGRITLSHFEGRDILLSSRLFDLSLRVEHGDLAALSRHISGISFEGAVDAYFPSIRFKEGRWTAEGTGKVRVFGGEIELQNLFAQNFFSPSRSFGGDLSFSGINLEEVTKKIEIGGMTGIVRGSLKDFKMEYGQPAAFILKLESDPTGRTARAISVDAIKNLSIIGTGSSAVGIVLNSGLNRFFKEYPYSRIGIECTLENDTFSLRGTIHEGGKEYLIRRAFFRGIDVVNQNPDNSISFQDMQERVSRIFRKGGVSKDVS